MVCNPEQVIGQLTAKSQMNFAKAFGRCRAAIKPAFINPFLNVDMGAGFQLQIALFGIGAVICFQRPLDIDRVRIMAFDQVAVVTVHRSHEIRQRAHNGVRQAGSET